MENRRLDNHRSIKQHNKRKRRRKRILRNVLLAVGCVCIIGVLEFWAFRHMDKINGNDGNNTYSQETYNGTINATAVDKEILNNLIIQASNINRDSYTADSVSALNGKIVEAEKIVGESQEQSEIANAYLDLMRAIQQLVLKD